MVSTDGRTAVVVLIVECVVVVVDVVAAAAVVVLSLLLLLLLLLLALLLLLLLFLRCCVFALLWGVLMVSGRPWSAWLLLLVPPLRTVEGLWGHFGRFSGAQVVPGGRLGAHEAPLARYRGLLRGFLGPIGGLARPVAPSGASLGGSWGALWGATLAGSNRAEISPI